MNNIIISFIITFIAGLSTCIGILPTYLNDKYREFIINFSLAFSASVMITISFISLIPEAFHYLKELNIFSILYVLIFINIGIILSIFIDKKLDKRINNNTLFKTGVFGFIAIILHNIPEGITTFISTSNDLKIGISMALAITLHNIPEGISIAIPIYYSTNSHKKAFFYTLISGFSEFFGAIISYLFLYELLPSSFKYKNNIVSFIGLFLGFIIMIICIFILKI